jgi:hypothetical protein
MDNQPKKNTEDELQDDAYAQDGSGRELQRTDNTSDDKAPEDDINDTDKYLALEQPGVQYTDETDPTHNSDQLDYSNPGQDDEWSEEGGNSKNSDAFNQDDYILEDNVDLDEDQNQSISTDDEDFEESNERYTN